MKAGLGITLTIAFLVAAMTPLRGDVDIPSELRGTCIYHPEPNWWAMARRGMRGRVVTQMTIDPKTGEVTEVKLLRKTIFAQLNAEIVLTAFKWRFKPGTITQAKVPFELEVRGWARELR